MRFRAGFLALPAGLATLLAAALAAGFFAAFAVLFFFLRARLDGPGRGTLVQQVQGVLEGDFLRRDAARAARRWSPRR